jgi:hypothetical protein
VFDVLAVLTVVHVSRENAMRIISFRHASEEERTAYHDWLKKAESRPLSPMHGTAKMKMIDR